MCLRRDFFSKDIHCPVNNLLSNGLLSTAHNYVDQPPNERAVEPGIRLSGPFFRLATTSHMND